MVPLIECENVECTAKYFKCLGYYCIPFRYVCNGLWECPGGMEENNCYIRSCPGLFKCLNSVICISPESLCDGIIDCPYGDDIRFCDMNLPVCPILCVIIIFTTQQLGATFHLNCWTNQQQNKAKLTMRLPAS